MLDMIVGAVVASSVSKVAEHAAVGVVGGIATYMDGKKALKEADENMKRMEMNERLLSERPNDFIQVRTAYNEMVNQYYIDVVKNLAGMGFYDININSIYKRKGLFDKEQKGIVARVNINGSSTFDAMSIFSKDSHVVVEAIVHNKGEYLYMPELEAIRRGSVMYQRPVRRCQYCNVAISDGQKYCIGCGAPV